MNLVPARFSALLVAAAASSAGAHGRAALRAALRDARLHKSPNAGWPEAATAGALGLALGGPRRYGDHSVEGAWLNPAGRRDAGPGDIRAAIRLIDRAWGILAVLAVLAALSALWIAR
jgi:adenosylcobinamide-phosphate synthase